ncbi:flagellar hook-basal body complex protein FliE [Pullulanibacillus pueri]|uniref:Flagellar hook-basal body complex protein FliE n=1 Tax=Pullulanibacillus pueri TaxID=1437324 RepID=A0A8J2ZWH0_9BACL|nr:flagellar hook-basal body complex protein FliE [Pullulanibacillus pueri]MBM7682473.1 flagellar hook-basal body complex protein FliE [Pullulanibacillus pueri]GGH82258.1 flagellar hook-basal body complex protein FliE [Pullulanibacillus pueri]
MTTPIQLLSNSSAPTALTASNKTNSVQSAQKSFSNILGQALDKVNQSETASDDAVNQLLSGKANNLHDVMIAMEKSEVTLKLAVEVRDKVVNAYQEVMRMQV